MALENEVPPVEMAITEAPVEAPKAPEPKLIPEEVFDRRVGQLTAQKSAAEKRADDAERRAQLAEETLKATGTTGTKVAEGERVYTKAELDAEAIKLADGLAEKKTAAKAAADRGDALYAEGKKNHADFDDTLKNYSKIGGFTQQFVDAAIETGAGADIIHALGNDLGEAQRIMGLPAVAQGVAMAKYAQDLVAKKLIPVSGAKAPLPVTVGGGGKKGTPTLYDTEELSTKDWIKQREKDLKEAGKRR